MKKLAMMKVVRPRKKTKIQGRIRGGDRRRGANPGEEDDGR